LIVESIINEETHNSSFAGAQLVEVRGVKEVIEVNDDTHHQQ